MKFWKTVYSIYRRITEYASLDKTQESHKNVVSAAIYCEVGRGFGLTCYTKIRMQLYFLRDKLILFLYVCSKSLLFWIIEVSVMSQTGEGRRGHYTLWQPLLGPPPLRAPPPKKAAKEYNILSFALTKIVATPLCNVLHNMCVYFRN